MRPFLVLTFAAALSLAACPKQGTPTAGATSDRGAASEGAAPAANNARAATTSEGKKGAPPPSIVLHLDWESGLAAAVSHVRTRDILRSDRSAAQHKRARAAWTWAVLRDGEAMDLQVSDYQREVVEAFEPTEGVAFDPVLDALVEAMPSMRIEGGRVVRVLDGDRVRREVEPLIAAVAAQAPSARRHLDTAASDEALLATAEGLWNILGQWDGTELTLGEMQSQRTSSAVPQLGGMELDRVLETTWEGWVPCTERGRDRACVRIQLRSFVDPEQVAAALEGFLATLGADSETPVIEDLRLDTDIELIAVPGTLVPHRASVRRLMNMRMAVPGEGRLTGSQEERRTWTFTWTRP